MPEALWIYSGPRGGASGPRGGSTHSCLGNLAYLGAVHWPTAPCQGGTHRIPKQHSVIPQEEKPTLQQIQEKAQEERRQRDALDAELPTEVLIGMYLIDLKVPCRVEWKHYDEWSKSWHR